jgi:uncharacterized membrane protein YhiD involved in acid resistance
MEPEEKKEKRSYKKRRGNDEPGGYLGGILAIVFIIVIFFGIRYVTNTNDQVKGAKTDAEKEKHLELEEQKAKKNVKENVDKRLEKIKEDIDNLNAVDVTTQSPQVKKIIEDLQSLQNLPKDQAKNFCEQVCRSFE